MRAPFKICKSASNWPPAVCRGASRCDSKPSGQPLFCILALASSISRRLSSPPPPPPPPLAGVRFARPMLTNGRQLGRLNWIDRARARPPRPAGGQQLAARALNSEAADRPAGPEERRGEEAPTCSPPSRTVCAPKQSNPAAFVCSARGAGSCVMRGPARPPGKCENMGGVAFLAGSQRPFGAAKQAAGQSSISGPVGPTWPASLGPAAPFTWPREWPARSPGLFPQQTGRQTCTLCSQRRPPGRGTTWAPEQQAARNEGCCRRQTGPVGGGGNKLAAGWRTTMKQNQWILHVTRRFGPARGGDLPLVGAHALCLGRRAESTHVV